MEVEHRKPLDKKVVVDLSQSSSAGVFEAGDGLIQRSALDDVEQFVGKIRKKIPEFKKKLESNGNGDVAVAFPRSHDTILICGARGTGKSTFMLSAVNFLCRSATENPSTGGLCSLGIIDPTLISGRENIFILIISRIREIVEKKIDADCSPENSTQSQREWLDMLSDLSRGLCMQDGIGKAPLEQSGWEDPGYILAEGLENAQSGLKLERRFHRFIDESLRIIGKQAFLLGFDDIDTNFCKGWPVLELLRKYLTTPQLIVLLSGDYSLYSMLVRREQWAQFKDHPQLINHYSEQNIQDIVEELESQYLIKILQPINRIDLKLPWELPDDLYIKSGDKGEDEILVRHVMSAFTEIWYKFPIRICQRIGGLFLHLPMRNLMNLLTIIETDGMQDSTRKQSIKRTFGRAKQWQSAAKKWLPKVPIPNEYIPDSEALLLMHSSLIFIYYDRLIAMGFTQDDLQSVQWVGQFSKLAKVLYDRKLLEHGADLLPSNVMQQDGLDILVLSGIFMSAMLGDIKHIADYYVRVLMVRDYVATRREKQDGKNDNEKIDALLFSQQSSLMDIAVHISREFLAYPEYNDGSLSYNRPEHNDNSASCSAEKQENAGTYMLNEILFNSIMLEHKEACKTVYKFSPFNLIALFGLCLGGDEGLEFDFKRFVRPAAASKDAESAMSHTAQYDEKVLKKFTNEIHDWAHKYHKKNDDSYVIERDSLLLPPYVHATIWREFVEKLRKNKGREGTIANCIDAFLESIKNEEKNFLNGKNDSKLLLYQFIKGCPLWAKIKCLDEFRIKIPTSGSDVKGG